MSNIVLNAGAGGATLGTDTVVGIDYQKVKVTFSTDGTAPTSVDATHPLPVVQTGALPAGANTIGAVTQASGPWTSNTTQLGGLAINLGTGVTGTGTQRVVLATDQPSLTNALPVAQSGTWTVSISGSVAVTGTFFQATQPISAVSLPLPTGAATAAKQPALGTAGAASTDVLTIQGIAAMTPVKVDGSGVTQPISGTVTSNQGTAASTAGRWPVQLTDGTNLSSLLNLTNSKPITVAIVDGAGSQITSFGGTGGTSITDGAAFTRGTTPETPVGGAVSTSAPTLTTGTAGALSLTTAGALRVDGSGVTQPVSIAGNQAVNVSQLAGTTTDTNSGNKSAGTLRVVIATDQPSLNNALPVSQSGTWTVTATPSQLTSGGPSYVNAIAPATPAATTTKGTAGQLLGLRCFNLNATPVYLKFFDTASAVTLGTTPATFQFMIPGNTGGAGFVVPLPDRRPCANAIKYAVTGGISLTDNTSITASSVIVDFDYV